MRGICVSLRGAKQPLLKSPQGSEKILNMNMKKEIAQSIIKDMEKIISDMNSTLFKYENSLSQEEFKFFKRGIAKLMNISDKEILENILKQYPDLAPY